jgi:hypothetical protein
MVGCSGQHAMKKPLRAEKLFGGFYDALSIDLVICSDFIARTCLREFPVRDTQA